MREAAKLRDREAAAIGYGAKWLLDLMQRGHVGPDCTVTVEGRKITIGYTSGRSAVLEWGGSRVTL